MTRSDDDDDAVGPTLVRDSLLGAKLGEYVVVSRLGSGAMGIVYRGLQPIIGRAVAIKVLKVGAAGDGLLAEARALASARHPNIIDIFSFGETPSGQPYFVMELLEGKTLEAWTKANKPTALQTVSILKQLFSGLAAAHAANVVHRDLKPANVFLASLPDGTSFVKILDFGLAKRVDPNAPEFTRGRVGGTPLYMSPEQIRGVVTGPYTDLYSAGVLAWELFTGAPPFSATTLLDMMAKHLRATPPPLPSSMPEGVAELLLSLLEKEPLNRPASAMAAQKQLERIERKLLVASGTSVALPRLDGPLPAAQHIAATSMDLKVPTPSRTKWFVLAAVPVLAGLGFVLWPKPKVEEVVPSPPPSVVEPVKVVEPALPEIAPEETAEPAKPTPIAPKPKAIERPRMQKRLTQLEERVLLQLVDDRQRMALRELEDLRKELETVSPAEARELVDEFEKAWLTR